MVSLKQHDMKQNSRERKRLAKMLLYYLDLYSELNKRGNAMQVVQWLEDAIDELVQELKK